MRSIRPYCVRLLRGIVAIVWAPSLSVWGFLNLLEVNHKQTHESTNFGHKSWDMLWGTIVTKRSMSMCIFIQRVGTFSFSTSSWCGGRGWQVPVVKYCEILTIFCHADIQIPLVAGWPGKLCYITSWDMANNIDSLHLHDRFGLTSQRFIHMLPFSLPMKSANLK